MKIKKAQLCLSESERQTISDALGILEQMLLKENDKDGKDTIATGIEALTVIWESYPED